MKLSKETGMILVEVMLALIVLTGGSMVIFQSFRNSMQVMRRSRALYEAALAIEGRVNELEKTGHWDEAKELLKQGLYTH